MTHAFKTIAIVATGAAALALAPSVGAKERQTGEQKLEELLEGRIAGKPDNCIPTYQSGNLQVIDGTALVYRRGKTIWVNIPEHPEGLDDNDILVTYPTSGSQLCRLDRVETRDRTGHFVNGIVFLGDFVPYTKVGG